ncbi:30S ribosomal protein S20 [uncultured bacterium]|nr:30S ribosomal protein S20 [uncultured bacterium]
MSKDKSNKKEIKNSIKRRNKKIRIEKRNRILNSTRHQKLRYYRKIFIRNKNINNFNKFISVLGKLVKVNFMHKNKMARLQRKYQLIFNDNK